MIILQYYPISGRPKPQLQLTAICMSLPRQASTSVCTAGTMPIRYKCLSRCSAMIARTPAAQAVSVLDGAITSVADDCNVTFCHLSVGFQEHKREDKFRNIKRQTEPSDKALKLHIGSTVEKHKITKKALVAPNIN